MNFRFRERARDTRTISFNRQLDLSELLADRDDLAALAPLSVQLQVKHESEAVQVHGNLSTVIGCICARCLESFEQPLQIQFRETFVHGAPNNPADDNDDEIIYVREDEVDLIPYVEEAVLLALPFIPHCKEQCAGLCPACGANRNHQACDCETESTDPRLEGLKSFFNR